MRVVLLDALGTLVALEPPAPALAAHLFDRIGAEVSPDDAARAIAAEIAFYRAHFDEGGDAAGVAALRRRCAAVVADALPGVGGLGPDDWLEILLASLHFTPFEDVEPALRQLRGGGARLIVVSNWDWSLHEVLARLGIAALVDGVVTSAEVGARKPAAAIFARALELAGGAMPGEALHVGDSVAEDVEGARASGIAPVLISRDGRAGPAGVRTVRSLLELVA